AVDAGKHVFAEKPGAVDAPGVRSVLESCEAAKKKNLSVVSGLCIRYDKGFRETVGRIHDGEGWARSRGGSGGAGHAPGERLPRWPVGEDSRQGVERHDVPDAQLVQLH